MQIKRCCTRAIGNSRGGGGKLFFGGDGGHVHLCVARLPKCIPALDTASGPSRPRAPLRMLHTALRSAPAAGVPAASTAFQQGIVPRARAMPCQKRVRDALGFGLCLTTTRVRAISRTLGPGLCPVRTVSEVSETRQKEFRPSHAKKRNARFSSAIDLQRWYALKRSIVGRRCIRRAHRIERVAGRMVM